MGWRASGGVGWGRGEAGAAGTRPSQAYATSRCGGRPVWGDWGSVAAGPGGAGCALRARRARTPACAAARSLLPARCRRAVPPPSRSIHPARLSPPSPTPRPAPSPGPGPHLERVEAEVPDQRPDPGGDHVVGAAQHCGMMGASAGRRGTSRLSTAGSSGGGGGGGGGGPPSPRRAAAAARARCARGRGRTRGGVDGLGAVLGGALGGEEGVVGHALEAAGRRMPGEEGARPAGAEKQGRAAAPQSRGGKGRQPGERRRPPSRHAARAGAAPRQRAARRGAAEQQLPLQSPPPPQRGSLARWRRGRAAHLAGAPQPQPHTAGPARRGAARPCTALTCWCRRPGRTSGRGSRRRAAPRSR